MSAGGPFRSRRGAEELLARLADAERATRRRVVFLAAGRAVFVVGALALALFVGHAAAWIAFVVLSLLFGGMEAMRWVAMGAGRRLLARITSGEIEPAWVHANEHVIGGRANLEIHGPAGEVAFLIAPPDLSRAIATAAHRCGVEVTTTEDEREKAALAPIVSE